MKQEAQTIQVRIKHLRKAHHLTQQAIAALLGVKQSTYSCYERGTRQIPLRVAEAAAEMFNVSPLYLLHGVTEAEASNPMPVPDITKQELDVLIHCFQKLGIIQSGSNLDYGHLCFLSGTLLLAKGFFHRKDAD